MRIFLAGIMQGSHLGADMHEQDYRSHLKRLLIEQLPQAELYDPLSDHQDSLDYHDELAQTVFMKHNRMCREVDVVVAFVPQASMGTAIEMWEAHRHGKVVIAISPLIHNWAVKFCSHAIFQNLAEFEQALKAGEVAALIENSAAEAFTPNA